MDRPILKTKVLDTPLGSMIAIASAEALYALDFADRVKPGKLERLQMQTGKIFEEECPPIKSLESELTQYFAGTLKQFQTPLFLVGTPFQKLAWQALACIPYGETKSYAEQAQAIGSPLSWRAVANANGANPLSIIVPCHRIIASNGTLGGYGGGIERKKWLLDHEKRMRKN